MSKKKSKRFSKKLRVPAGGSFRIDAVDPDDTLGLKDKKEARKRLADVQDRLADLQEVLYAQSKHAVLVVLQAMDSGGKDSTIRHVFGPLNPQGVKVTSFKKPNAEELSHDYLWRIHRAVPPKGMIGIFNRSHYEDVLVARVHDLAPTKEIDKRYDQINAFEKYLSQNNVTIIKFLLHIGRDEQKERLQARLDRPDKHWKFDSADLRERKRWKRYMDAFDRVLNRCSARHAPWYVIPANHKWSRDLAVGSIVLETLAGLDLEYPAPEAGLDEVVIPD